MLEADAKALAALQEEAERRQREMQKELQRLAEEEAARAAADAEERARLEAEEERLRAAELADREAAIRRALEVYTLLTATTVSVSVNQNDR